MIVERRATGPVPHDQVDDLEVPNEAEERSAWLVAGALRLADAVRETGPAAGVWSWAEDQKADFWLRRITHDTLVHRLDAELTVGRATAVPPDLAADSVTDLLDMFRVLPRIDHFPALAGLRGHGQTLHFHATDPLLGAAGEWLARRTPTGVEWEHRHDQAGCRRPRPGHGPAARTQPAGSAGPLPIGGLRRPATARPLAGAQPVGPGMTDDNVDASGLMTVTTHARCGTTHRHKGVAEPHSHAAIRSVVPMTGHMRSGLAPIGAPVVTG